MFEKMRRSDRETTMEETVQLMGTGEYGILTTIGTNGYPYGIPVNYVYFNDKIYFHCAKGVGTKIKNIEANDKVCFTVVGGTEVLPDQFSTIYESAVSFGRAKEIDGEAKKEALIKIIEKYSPEFMTSGLKYINNAFDKTGIYEITVDHMSGKARR